MSHTTRPHLGNLGVLVSTLRAATVQVFAVPRYCMLSHLPRHSGVGQLAAFCSAGVPWASQAVLCASEVTLSTNDAFPLQYHDKELCKEDRGVVEPPWAPC